MGLAPGFGGANGRVTPDTVLRNARAASDERLHQLLSVRGAATEPIQEVMAGQVLAVAKLASAGTGDTLAANGLRVGRRLVAAPAARPRGGHRPEGQGRRRQAGTRRSTIRPSGPSCTCSPTGPATGGR